MAAQKPTKTENRTIVISEPWKLSLPADLVESIQAVSKLTGQTQEQLIAETIRHNWEEVRAEKKKSTAERIKLLASDGLTVAQVANVVGLGYWKTYKLGRSVGVRKFHHLTPEKRKEIVTIIQSDRLSLRELSGMVGISKSVLAEIRKCILPIEPDTVRPHRCSGCGGMITSPICLCCKVMVPA